jgi:hypothetical protein
MKRYEISIEGFNHYSIVIVPNGLGSEEPSPRLRGKLLFSQHDFHRKNFGIVHEV